MTKTELFIKLAQPNENGISRWVDIDEFVGEYASLTFGNGASWARKESTLAKRYIIEFDKSITPGNGIDRIRLNGFNDGDYSQHIRADIKRAIKARRCVVLGTSNPEVDHKNGMKNNVPSAISKIYTRIFIASFFPFFFCFARPASLYSGFGIVPPVTASIVPPLSQNSFFFYYVLLFLIHTL